MKKLFATIIIALVAAFLFCSHSYAQKHETVIVSVFERNFKHPVDYEYDAVWQECDSLIKVALDTKGDNCCFKDTTMTMFSSYYLFKKRVNGHLFVECYHIPAFSPSRLNCGAWMSADDLFRVLYDDRYKYEVGCSDISFNFVKQSIIKI